MGKSVYNTFGTIIKKEQLASVQNEINANLLVLENLAPYPGYHGTTVPDSLEADSLFAVTKIMHKEEVIIRAILEVKNILPFDFDATPGSLSIQNEVRTCIRFKGLKYSLVGEVLTEFSKQGIIFRKAKKIAPYDTIIRIHKFFSLEKISENIYKDLDNENMNYFSIPDNLRWGSFEKMTMNCKYNCEDNNFDAAIATLFMNKGIADLVRIYDQKSSLEKLKNIRQLYIEAFEKL